MNGSYPGIPSNTGTRRLRWDGLPASVRDQIEGLLGQRVVATVSQPGGFSEGLAVRARLADGSGVFIKAAHTSAAAASHHRREITVSRRLPASAPVPRLLRTVVAAGSAADPNIVAMMTALGMASVQWLRRRWRVSSAVPDRS